VLALCSLPAAPVARGRRAALRCASETLSLRLHLRVHPRRPDPRVQPRRWPRDRGGKFERKSSGPLFKSLF
jgi:hypothetical protein